MPETEDLAPVAAPVPALSQGQALLRVAFLVAYADGHQATAEVEAIARLVQERMPSTPYALAQTWAIAAATDVAQFPREEVLARIAAALPTPESRRLALHVGCSVANADRRLALIESRELTALAAALDVPQPELARIARAFW